MSDNLGPRTFGKKEELVFLGREISEQRDYSDKIAEAIDNEVHDLIHTAYTTATDLLTTNRAKLAQISLYLIENETVEGDDLAELFDSEVPPLEQLEIQLEARGSMPSGGAPRSENVQVNGASEEGATPPVNGASDGTPEAEASTDASSEESDGTCSGLGLEIALGIL